MPARYVCGQEGRRQAVRDAAVAINGIDFLEVSDDQLHLSVHFLKTPVPGGIGTANVVIQGGTRVTGVNILSAMSAGESLEVEVDRPGDFSTYTLQIVDVTELDPRLSAVEFSFKINCPSDFDCKSGKVCPPEVPKDPDIDYLARDYASFRRLMLDRLSLLAPQWQERNAADLGIALVETLAYVGDHQSYKLDAVGTEAYLGTARRRISVRRHARLRDYFMHDGASARILAAFEVEADSSADGALLQGPNDEGDHGTQLLTHTGSERATIPSTFLPQALAAGAIVFETLHDLTLHEAHNEIPFHTWNDQSCCLPVGSTAATLRGPLPDLSPGDLLLFEEIVGANTGARADADPEHRHAVRLTEVNAGVDPLDSTAVVEVEWPAADALPFPLCLSSIDAGGLAIEVSVARGNLVVADQGLTHDEDSEVPEHTATGLTLQNTPLAHCHPLVGDHRERPARELIKVRPENALPQVWLDQNDQTWRARRDLLGSGSSDRHFVAETDEEGRAHLRFGDDVHGMSPEPGSFAVAYRTGSANAGNVGFESVAHVIDAPEGVLRVRNPLAAWGGVPPESLDQVKAYAPHSFKVQERAVTDDDYAEVAQRHPEVQRAVATSRSTGSWRTVFLSIDRSKGRPVVEDDGFIRSMLQHMDRYRMAGRDLEINGPRFVPLDLALRVCVEAEHFRGRVRAELLQRFGTGTLPDGQLAFFHPDRWTFGQDVYLSQIYAAASTVTGVASVEVIRLLRWRGVAGNELSLGLLPVGRAEIVRLDNDPNFQENGHLQVEMVGGR